MSKPLADRIRPTALSDVVGQEHLLGENKILKRILETGNIPNMIFYGPSGTGKTTVANIAAKTAGKKLYKLNATNASVSDIKKIVSELDGFEAQGSALLYLDEIQNFNKKQQQSLLEFIEDGRITLIASTTENPHFYVYNAILSRSTVFEFKPVDILDIENAVKRAVDILKSEGISLIITDDVLRHIAGASGGDVRKAVNTVEVLSGSLPPDENNNIVIDLESAENCTSKRAMRYDRDGDSHYDILSAFQKSIRGSDPDAAVHYLARLIEGGDLISICRRIMVIAAEDIGLAYPMAITVTKSCVDCALQLGFPEARIPLSEAVLLLANAPKSNSAIVAVDEAISDIEKGNFGDIPPHLKDSHYQGAAKLGRGLAYQYPHNFPGNYVNQQYLPDNIKDRKYYVPGKNKNEQAYAAFWNEIKNRT